MSRYEIIIQGTGDYELYDRVTGISCIGKCDNIQAVLKALGEEPLEPEGGECFNFLEEQAS